MPLLLGLITVFPGVLSAENLLLQEKLENKSLGRYIEYLEDPAGKLTFEQVSADTLPEKNTNLKWVVSRDENLGKGYTRSVYWVRLVVENQRNKTLSWYLQQKYPLIDELTLYIPLAQGGYKKIDGGDWRPFYERPLIHRTFVFPLETPAGDSQTYYIRYFTRGTLNIHLSAWTPIEFLNFKEFEFPILWLYYGFIFVMIVYNSFIFVSVKDRSYFYYVTYLIFFLLTAMSLNGTAFQYLWPRSTWWANYSTPFFIGLTVAALLQFSLNFMRVGEHAKIPARILKGFALLSAMLGLGAVIVSLIHDDTTPGGPDFYRIFTSSAAALAGLSTLALVMVALYLAVIKKSRQAIFYSISFIGFCLGVVMVVLQNWGITPSHFIFNYSMQFGSAFEVVVLSVALADRINTMSKELGILNTKLEGRVVERTRQLQKTLDDLQILKDKQDGDYFLTSLLLEPLQKNMNDSERIRTDFKVEQFKKFRFKHWQSEIGGDLCATDRIMLGGRWYVFFVNGDAMGKSVQGAGGALVLGASMASHINESKLGFSDPFLPEIWLRNFYLDLQHLFVVFECSMMLSLVMGLVDESTGLVYYINSEHPWTVLYRNGTASFLEDDITLRKVGVPGEEKHLRIKLFQMEKDDKIFMGSDGRDDLITERRSGEIIVNYDETMFLQAVERSDGQLSVILPEIAKGGEILDDLSILTLQLTDAPDVYFEQLTPGQEGEVNRARKYLREGSPQKALNILKENFEGERVNTDTLRLLASIYRALGDEQGVAETLLRYNEVRPDDTKFMIALAKGLIRAGRLERALATVESIELREPENVKFLMQLAALYETLGEPDKARACGLKAHTLDKDHPVVRRVLRKFRRYAEATKNTVNKEPPAPLGRFKF